MNQMSQSQSGEHSSLPDIKTLIADIRQMHRDISRITENKDRRCYDYLEDFAAQISHLIDKLVIFPYHMIWECVSQEIPGHPELEKSVILWDLTEKKSRDAFLKESNFLDYGREKYFKVHLSKDEFIERFDGYFQDGSLEKVFDFPVKPGYSYFNLPVFSESETMPQWILTLIYREEDTDLIDNGEFVQSMELLSYETGMAWDKFLEEAATKLLGHFDYQLAWAKKTESDSTIDQLRIISRILVRELQLDWCGFSLVNELENTLNPEAANIDLDIRLEHRLTDDSDIFVKSLTGNKLFRLLGRENLEEIITPEKMKPMEKAIRSEIKKKKRNREKNYFTPYILFEHALLFPIDIGTRRPGIITLFRSQRVQYPEVKDKSRYVTRPFTRFETHLLRSVQRYVFYILISYNAVQRRMRDTRNMIAQVVSPISALISSTRGYAGKSMPGDTSLEKVAETLHYINALSISANQYLANFEILLDIDTRKLHLQREYIPDLRKYLIDLARLYIPLSRKKFIHINVTDQTPNDISIEVDRDLFDTAISNIIENAVKYSFDPDERLKLGLKAKPDTDDKENVRVTAEQDENSTIITISNYGQEIPESERGKIFDRDFRGTYAPDGGKGSGLGLYLAKEIIEKHGGTIELVPGTTPHNTVFKIVLWKQEEQ